MKLIVRFALLTIKLLELKWVTDGYLLKLPNDLAELCPLTTFCNRTVEAAPLRPGYVACCQSCGCDAGCGRRRDCCTYEMDRWRLDEKNISTCVSPVLYAGQAKQPSTFWYHMVDQCSDETHDCISDRLYPWGSMFPHSSLTDGFVYYNEFCALCNANSSLVPWQMKVACQMDEFGGKGVSYTHKVILSLKGRSGEVGCFLYFIPPPELDVRFERCFPEENIIRHCNDDSNNTNGIMTDLQNKCHSFNATYTPYYMLKDVVYANVYCYICLGSETRLYSECKSQEEAGKLLTDTSFVMVLDNVRNMLDQPEISSRTREHCYQDVCRPVLCPEGRINMDGACKPVYLIVETLCNIYVKLKFRQPVDGLEIDAFENFSSSNLNMHDLNGWNVTVFVATNLNSSVPKYLIARVYTYLEKRNFYTIISRVKRCVTLPWTLTVQGRSWSFSVSFFKYTRFRDSIILSANNTVMVGPYWWKTDTHLWQASSERITVLFTHWRQMVYYDISLKHASFLEITKLFFCNQVELLEAEFVDLEHEIVLVRHNRTLQEGEFTRVSESLGTEKIRVCLEEITGLQTENQASDFSTTTMNAIFVVVALRILIAFIQ